jgi:hypothetical protein
MLCRGAAPLARYRRIDTDEANVAIRVPKKLLRRIKCFVDRVGGLHGGLAGKTGRRRQFLPGGGPPILSMRKMSQTAPHAPRRGTTKRLEGTSVAQERARRTPARATRFHGTPRIAQSLGKNGRPRSRRPFGSSGICVPSWWCRSFQSSCRLRPRSGS